MPKKKSPKKSPKKKKKAQLCVPELNNFDVDKLLLLDRNIFIFDVIDEKMSKTIIKQLLMLDSLAHAPIYMWINSPGGSVGDGFAIIDAMNGIKSDIVTLIVGKACSMAGLISICGSKRLMSEHAVWMGHDGHAGQYDYFTKMFDRTDFYKRIQTTILNLLTSKTKLTQKELDQLIHGELWLSAEECIEKGIIESIIK